MSDWKHLFAFIFKTLFILGVGNANLAELKVIASGNTAPYVTMISNFDSLNTIASSMAKSACNECKWLVEL